MLTEGDYGDFRVTIDLDTGPFGGKISGSAKVRMFPKAPVTRAAGPGSLPVCP